jgi:hypothetical protein
MSSLHLHWLRSGVLGVLPGHSRRVSLPSNWNLFLRAVSRLAAEYGRFDSLDLSPPPPLHGLQAQTLFAMHGSSENCLGTFLSLSSVCAC